MYYELYCIVQLAFRISKYFTSDFSICIVLKKTYEINNYCFCLGIRIKIEAHTFLLPIILQRHSLIEQSK